MATLLQHSTFPQNEPWYLRAMASKSREEVGHTKEGQQHANRLESIAKMLEAAAEIERERDELRLRFSEADAELARLRQPMTLMSPCEKHKGMPWSTSGSSVVTGTYVMPRMVCPHCPEAPK